MWCSNRAGGRTSLASYFYLAQALAGRRRQTGIGRTNEERVNKIHFINRSNCYFAVANYRVFLYSINVSITRVRSSKAAFPWNLPSPLIRLVRLLLRPSRYPLHKSNRINRITVGVGHVAFSKRERFVPRRKKKKSEEIRERRFLKFLGRRVIGLTKAISWTTKKASKRLPRIL